MKLIAHRGASLERPENTIESLEFASELGAYAVECDVRFTADENMVIYHDNDLSRLAGRTLCVDEVTEAEMRKILRQSGRDLLSLSELLSKYKGKAKILLHIKPDSMDDEFFRLLAASDINFVCGVQNIETARLFRRYFPSESILAFMPQMNQCREFCSAGVGIIRLWEHWLDRVTPEDVKRIYPEAEVWIMSSRPETGMNGSLESLERLDFLGADGVLLNDIRLGVDWKKAVR